MSDPAESTAHDDGLNEEAGAIALREILGLDVDEPDEFDDLMAPPVHWPALAAGDLEQRMLTLWRWATDLQHRFPEMVRLPACWHRHNGIVELLQALADHERGCYAPTSPPTGGVSWHIAFRDVEARLRSWIAELKCNGEPNHRGTIHDVTRPPAEPAPDIAAWISEAAAVRESTG